MLVCMNDAMSNDSIFSTVPIGFENNLIQLKAYRNSVIKIDVSKQFDTQLISMDIEYFLWFVHILC